MLMIPTYIDVSPINGFGLFTAKDIYKDTVLWKFDKYVDLSIPLSEIRERCLVDPLFASYVRHRGYVDKLYRDQVIFHADNEQFKNDSTSPNTSIDPTGKLTVALRDIEAGEELSINYEAFIVDTEFTISITWRGRVLRD